MERARKIVEDFKSRPIFRDFSVPVEGLAGYRDKVHKPMDLGTVGDNLRKSKYATTADWLEDARLVFQNACDYWGEEHVFSLIAQYGLTELDRFSAGMDARSDQEWLEQVDSVSTKLTADIGRRPAGSKASKLAEDYARRAKTTTPVSNDDTVLLVEKLNTMIADDSARETVIEILRQMEGMKIEESIKEPIPAEGLKEETIRALKLFSEPVA